MLRQFENVKIRLNGDLSTTFKETYYAEYFSGDVTLTMGDASYTLSIHNGDVIATIAGSPLTGLDIGVTGSEEAWAELYAHKNFHRAVSPRHGKLRLQGNLVRCMGNLNCLSCIVKTLAAEV